MLGSFTNLVVDRDRGLRSEQPRTADGTVLIRPARLDVPTSHTPAVA